ncbi:MAG: DUF4203 domain-containing protein [Candidatus Krumholzibacteriota bacterium]|nr:DUF4203 domain-containing protein [Candidatus Krumholzibacteriota bacterium]
MMIDSGAMNGFAVISILFGVVSCFWGYRAFKVVLGIAGVIAGAWLAGGIAATFTGGFGVVALIAAVAGGLIAGSIFVTLYYIGIFVIGAAAGWLFGVMITSMAGNSLHIIAFVILAVLGGILAVSFQRLVLTISTGVIGSWYIVAGTLLFFGSGLSDIIMFRVPGEIVHGGAREQIIVLSIWLFLAISGIVFQYGFGRRKKVKGD